MTNHQLPFLLNHILLIINITSNRPRRCRRQQLLRNLQLRRWYLPMLWCSLQSGAVPNAQQNSKQRTSFAQTVAQSCRLKQLQPSSPSLSLWKSKSPKLQPQLFRVLQQHRQCTSNQSPSLLKLLGNRNRKRLQQSQSHNQKQTKANPQPCYRRKPYLITWTLIRWSSR